MKQIWIVQEMTSDEQGNWFPESSNLYYSSHKKAITTLNETKDVWLELGYELVEEGIFPNEYIILKNKYFKRLIKVLPAPLF